MGFIVKWVLFLKGVEKKATRFLKKKATRLKKKATRFLNILL